MHPLIIHPLAPSGRQLVHRTQQIRAHALPDFNRERRQVRSDLDTDLVINTDPFLDRVGWRSISNARENRRLHGWS